jgi:uncharacterized protein
VLKTFEFFICFLSLHSMKSGIPQKTIADNLRLDYQQLIVNAEVRYKQNAALIKKIARNKKINLDIVFQQKDEEVFNEIDCLQCANCCKTTSPIFTDKDIGRLARHFRIRPVEFIQRYLIQDKDGDYVVKSSPCPFLDEDNFCTVYSERPAACRDYPHLRRKSMKSYLALALRNTLVCPAVAEVFARIDASFNNP